MSRLILIMMFIPGLVKAQSVPEIIHGIMDNQQSCWNKGDLECFMIGYWQSDSLMFIGKDSVYFGFDSTLGRYRTAYPDRESMGKLTFEFLSMQPLGESSYFVLGKYHLQRTIGDVEGHFTLLWRKIDDHWVIVADHSS